MTNKPLAEFRPPKLPFKWLAATFISPTLVVVLPSIIIDTGISFEHRVIVGLILLSVMLLVSVIATSFASYDSALIAQQQDARLGYLEEIVNFHKSAHQFNLDNAMDFKSSFEKVTKEQLELIQMLTAKVLQLETQIMDLKQ